MELTSRKPKGAIMAKKMNHLDIEPTLSVTSRSDSRSITGKFLGKGVKAVKVGRPAAGYGLDEDGEYTVPKCGWIALDEWVAISTKEELMAERVGTPTKWDGIGYFVEIDASEVDVRRLMPIIKEGHYLPSKGKCGQPVWHVKKGGIASPFYLSLEFHERLTKIANELPVGTIKVTLFRYDKGDPFGCELKQLDAPIVETWRNKDERSRILSKKKMSARAMSLLDKVDTTAEPYREKKRFNERREIAKAKRSK